MSNSLKNLKSRVRNAMEVVEKPRSKAVTWTGESDARQAVNQAFLGISDSDKPLLVDGFRQHYVYHIGEMSLALAAERSEFSWRTAPWKRFSQRRAERALAKACLRYTKMSDGEFIEFVKEDLSESAWKVINPTKRVFSAVTEDAEVKEAGSYSALAPVETGPFGMGSEPALTQPDHEPIPSEPQ